MSNARGSIIFQNAPFVLKRISRFLLSPVVALVIGVLGIALSIIFYFRDPHSARPVYLTFSKAHLSKSLGLEPLKFYWNGDEQTNVNVTVVQLWNAGDKPILTADFGTPSDPIRITVRGKSQTKILDAKVTYSSHPHAPKLQIVQTSSDTVVLKPTEADSLDHNDGVQVQIVFSGDSDANCELRGRVVGMTGFAMKRWDDFGRPEPATSLVAMTIMFIGYCIYLVSAALRTIRAGLFDLDDWEYGWKPVLRLLGALLLILLLISIYHNQFFKPRLPPWS